MKDSLKKYVSTRRKESLWFVATSQKICFTNRNEPFVEKYVSTTRKNCFFWQKNRKWFPLAVTVSTSWPVWLNGWVFVYELSVCGFESRCSHLNIFLIKLIHPHFNHGFQKQKQGCELKHIVSTRQKISFHLPEWRILWYKLDIKVTFGGSNICKK